MPDNGGRSPRAVLAVILLAALLPRLATLRRAATPAGRMIYQHLEIDEQVFQTLVGEVRRDPFHYSLRGTPLLGHLDKSQYDFPMFFHPPAFVYAARLLGFIPLPLIPVLMNLGTIALVFWIGRKLYDQERGLWAAFLAAACPVGWFLSQKIWLDNMMMLTATASVAAHLWACERENPWSYAVSGAAFGLAFLSKVTAALVIFPLAAITWQKEGRGLSLRKAAAFLIPAVLLCGGWELLLKNIDGMWLPKAFPNSKMIADFPFVALVVARPWYFYLANIALISPVYLFAILPASRPSARELPLILWFLAFWVAMTAFGLMGGGYQTRYLAAAYPALALLAAEPLPRLRAPGLIAMAALVGYGMMNAFLYAVLETPQAADFDLSAAGVVAQAAGHVETLGGKPFFEP